MVGIKDLLSGKTATLLPAEFIPGHHEIHANFSHEAAHFKVHGFKYLLLKIYNTNRARVDASHAAAALSAKTKKSRMAKELCVLTCSMVIVFFCHACFAPSHASYTGCTSQFSQGCLFDLLVVRVSRSAVAQ